jgi:hypothetical protein
MSSIDRLSGPFSLGITVLLMASSLLFYSHLIAGPEAGAKNIVLPIIIMTSFTFAIVAFQKWSAISDSRVLFAVVLVYALAQRIIYIQLYEPQTDVYFSNDEAARTLLQLHNPYSHEFTSVPPYARSAYAYPPLSFLIYVPFTFLGVDLRYANAVLDIGSAILIFEILKGRIGRNNAVLASSLWLFMPVIVWNSSFWGNSIAVSTFTLLVSSYFLLRRTPVASGIFMALSVSAYQLSLFPLLYFLAFYLRNGIGSRFLRGFLPVLMTLNLPFLVWNTWMFFYGTIWFHLVINTTIWTTGNFGLNGLLQNLLGAGLPLTFGVTFLVLFIIVTLPRKSSVDEVFLYSGASIFLFVNVLMYNAFAAYFSLSLTMLLLALRHTGGGHEDATSSCSGSNRRS